MGRHLFSPYLPGAPTLNSRAHADIHRAHSLPRAAKQRKGVDSAFPRVADIDLSPLRARRCSCRTPVSGGAWGLLAARRDGYAPLISGRADLSLGSAASNSRP